MKLILHLAFWRVSVTHVKRGKKKAKGKGKEIERGRKRQHKTHTHNNVVVVVEEEEEEHKDSGSGEDKDSAWIESDKEGVSDGNIDIDREEHIHIQHAAVMTKHQDLLSKHEEWSEMHTILMGSKSDG